MGYGSPAHHTLPCPCQGLTSFSQVPDLLTRSNHLVHNLNTLLFCLSWHVLRVQTTGTKKNMNRKHYSAVSS